MKSPESARLTAQPSSAAEIHGRLGWTPGPLLAACASSAPGVSPGIRRNRPSDRPGLLACPWPRAFRHSRSDPRLAAPARLPLLPSVASPPFSGRGVHLGAVPAALTRPVSKRGRAPAGVRRHRPRLIHRPAHLGCRTDRLGRLSCGIRFASLRRMPAAPCRPGVPTSGPSRFGVWCEPRHPSRGRVALAVFVPRASR
jgi:hypothetical protein